MANKSTQQEPTEQIEGTKMGKGQSKGQSKTGTRGTQEQEGSAQTQQAREGAGEGDTVHKHRTAKIIEIVGSSPAGFQQAIERAVKDARETIGDIHGAEVQNMNVEVANGQIAEYKVDLKVSFGIQGT